MLQETLDPLTTCDAAAPTLCPTAFFNEQLHRRTALEFVSTLQTCGFECMFTFTLSV